MEGIGRHETKSCCFCHLGEDGPANVCFAFPELAQLPSFRGGSSTKAAFTHMECAAFSDGIRHMIGRWNPADYVHGIPPELTSMVAEHEVTRTAELKCAICLEGNASVGCMEVCSVDIIITLTSLYDVSSTPEVKRLSLKCFDHKNT